MADAITTKNITSVDEVQSVDNTDKVFVNDNGSFKQITVSNLMKQAPTGITEETDPTVPTWAKQPTKPSYTADEVGALPVGTKIPAKTSDLTNDSGYLTQIPEEYVTETELGQKGYITEDDIPEKLPSPGTLTFTGAVNDTYDGSADKTINIPTGGGEGGTSGSGISTSAKKLLLTILKNALYASDQSQNIKNLQTEFGITDDTYSIVYDLGNGISCTNSQTEINNGESYYTQIISDEGYSISSVSIKMSGIDITSNSYLNGNINIDSVNGNIEITVESIKNVITENLFNANTSIDGKFCNIMDGNLSSNLNYSVSDYILLEKGKKYRIETYTDNSYTTNADCVIIFTSGKEYYSYKQYSKGSGNPMLLYAEIQVDTNSYIRINLLTKYKDSTTVKEVKE